MPAYTGTMKLAVLALLAACQSGGGDDYPTGLGGGGPIVVGGGGGGGDAGTGDGGDSDAGVELTGRVCILKDLRQPTVCDAAQNALGLRVSLGTRTTTTIDKAGSFRLTAPLGAGFTWHVTGDVLDRIVTTAMPFGTENTIPVVPTQLYRDLLSTNKVEVLDQEGSIVVRVVSGVTPVANVSATSTLAASLTLYDSNNSALDWNESPVGRTAAAGVVWFPDVPLAVVPPTLTTITLTPQGGTPVGTLVTVENQAITFVTKDLL